MIKRVHHIGIAVNNLKESAALFEKVFRVKAHFESATSQKVSEAVFKIGQGAEIDLLEPTGPESVVAKYLEKRGEGLHHVALEVDNVDKELKAAEIKGIQLIDKTGREGVAGKIGFLHPKSLAGVMIELVQPGEK
ncbi:MAG: VOC family protein [Dehalococcoidales bacterium]